MLRFLPLIVSLALMIYALVDCLQDEGQEHASLPKPIWLISIVFVPFAGPIAWLVVSRRASPSRPARGRRAQPGPLAPDDDPEFLASLDKRFREPDEDGPTPGDYNPE